MSRSYARSRPNLPNPPLSSNKRRRAYVIEASTLFIWSYLPCVPHAGCDNVAVSSKRRFRLLLQLNADFLRKRAQGDHFDILTKGSLLRPPNGTKSKNHHGYLLGYFPLTISAKRNEGVAEVYIPMARAG
jgi:hypothetical protein